MNKLGSSIQRHSFFWLCLVVFIFSFAIRIYQISSIPAFVVSDEIQYISEARSLGISGRDLSGSWSPLSLTSASGWYAELPGSMMLPATLLFWNDPMLSAKVTHVLMGSFIPLLLGGIALSVFKNKRMAAFILTLAAINPWLFQFSRLAFESYFSLFFYLLGMYVFLAFSDWKKLWALAPFFLGFFQYQGHKLLLVPFVLLLALYLFADRFLEKKKWAVQLSKLERATIVIVLFSLILTGIFIYRLPSQAAGERTTQISFLDSEGLSTEVNAQRQASITNPLQPLFTNKATVFIHDATAKYLGTFNFVYLFSGGANSSDSWAVTSHGKFFLLDILLIIAGLTYFSDKKYQRGLTLVIALLLISPLPGMLATGPLWATFRTAFVIPFLLLLAGAGAERFYTLFGRKFFTAVAVVYILFTLPFFYDYFFRYPIYSTGDVYFYNRVMASYVKRSDRSDKTLILADETRHLFITLLFYNGWLTKETYPGISAALNSNLYIIDNLEVRENCFDPELIIENPLVLVQRHIGNCAGVDESSTQYTDKISIPSLLDSGEVVRVYGDTLCSQYPLNSYSQVTTNSFTIETLSDKDFCQTYFIRYE